MKTIYFDYNLFNHLQIALDGSDKTHTERENEDHIALLTLWNHYNNSEIEIITCEDDSIMEFSNFDPTINNYSEIKSHFANKNRMRRRHELFEKVKKGKLLICPFGEYGFGRGPYGGGPDSDHDLLKQIRIMLNRTSPENPQKDRDARHIIHSTLYGCDYCVTMDYRMYTNYLERHKLIESFLSQNNYRVKIITPSKLLKKNGSTGIDVVK